MTVWTGLYSIANFWYIVKKKTINFCHKVTLLNYHLIHIGSLKVHPSGNSVKVKFDCQRFSHFVTVPDCRSRSQESSRERNSEYGSKDNGNETIFCVVLDYALFQYILTTTISEDLQLRLLNYKTVQQYQLCFTSLCLFLLWLCVTGDRLCSDASVFTWITNCLHAV